MTTATSIMTVLIPAAGFGKRNPTAPIKELMTYDGRPLLDYSLELLNKTQSSHHFRVILITRQIKTEAFRQYFNSLDLKINIEFLIHEPGLKDEWPQTLLRSQHLWSQKNLVLLPDTKLMLQNNKNIVDFFDHSLNFFKTFWGLVEKPLAEVGTYGQVCTTNDRAISIIEKPMKPSSPWVWGCFGFTKDVGAELLNHLEQSTLQHQNFLLPEPSGYFKLKAFEDLSRGFC